MECRGHQSGQPLVAFPHVAWLHGHVNLEAAREAQLGPDTQRECNNFAAQSTCFSSWISIHTAPGPWTLKPTVTGFVPGFCRGRLPTTASPHRTSSVALAPVGAWRCLRRCCSQLANVVYLIPAHFAKFFARSSHSGRTPSGWLRAVRVASLFDPPHPVSISDHQAAQW